MIKYVEHSHSAFLPQLADVSAILLFFSGRSSLDDQAGHKPSRSRCGYGLLKQRGYSLFGLVHVRVFGDDLEELLYVDGEVDEDFVGGAPHIVVLEVDLGAELGDCLVNDVISVEIRLGTRSLNFCLNRENR